MFVISSFLIINTNSARSHRQLYDYRYDVFSRPPKYEYSYSYEYIKYLCQDLEEQKRTKYKINGTATTDIEKSNPNRPEKSRLPYIPT